MIHGIHPSEGAFSVANKVQSRPVYYSTVHTDLRQSRPEQNQVSSKGVTVEISDRAIELSRQEIGLGRRSA